MRERQRRRKVCWWAVLAFCVFGAGSGVGTEPRWVFVDINRLVAMALGEVGVVLPFPAPAPSPRVTQWTVFLPAVPTIEALDGAVASVARWRSSWMSAIESEANAVLRTVTAPEHVGVPRLAIPVRPPMQTGLSPEEWRFLVEQVQTQIVERARIRLRLAFADRLSAVEREQLRQRLQALDEALRLPLAPPPPLPPPPTVPPSRLTTLTPLTDEQQIVALVTPSPNETETTGQLVDWRLPSLPLTPRGDERLAVWRAVQALAGAFATAYGRERGWRVVFDPTLPADDKTAEVLAAWRQWWR
ncbi:hypothetical protein HRbin17_02518 [bacterium HR17]|uniref:Uncharacterized protein n=1 Tax=Candidatus Fervidibacter japonicus TaxID=2035412 RepID=A0A2H5XFN9_9BACT|nr:hypothetical protein HRbin17_02518 [bacterium HR17]